MAGRVDLEAVQARADAATEGPWAWEATGDKDNSWAVGYVIDEDERPLSGQLETGQGIVVEGICEGIDGNLADAVFIAHARTDVPALVAELRGVREDQGRLARIRVLLDTSPFGPTLADLRRLAFAIRQVAFEATGQPATTDQPPGAAP